MCIFLRLRANITFELAFPTLNDQVYSAAICRMLRERPPPRRLESLAGCIECADTKSRVLCFLLHSQ
jgi:hypothetical protein